MIYFRNTGDYLRHFISFVILTLILNSIFCFEVLSQDLTDQSNEIENNNDDLEKEEDTVPEQNEINLNKESTTKNKLNKSEFIEVEFYKPEPAESKKEERIKIYVSGKTQKNTIIQLGTDKIPYLNKDKKIEYLEIDDVINGPKKVTADTKGLFALAFDFPRENIQLTVKLISKNNTQSFLLSIDASSPDIKVTNKKDLKDSPLYVKKYSIWMGAGFNYLNYNQESTDIRSDLEFQTFKAPSFFAKSGWHVNDKLDASITAKVSPGEATSSSETGGIQVSNGTYNWMIYALEGTYYPPNWTHEYFGKYPSKWGVRTGIQHHIVPFIARTGVSEVDTEIVTNNLTMFTIGFQNNVAVSSKWLFEWFMRYQSPISVGNTFTMRPKFAFDGSLGMVYSFSRTWKLGGFWYGQWHNYGFTHTDKYLEATASSANINGTQSLFFSNIELRLGYEFN